MKLWLYDTETADLTRLTTTENGHSFHPIISAGGRYVVFDSSADFNNEGIPDNQYEIWRYDTLTRTFTRLTNSGQKRDSTDPHISPDGTSVIFRSNADFAGHGTPENQGEIWLFKADVTTKPDPGPDPDPPPNPNPGGGFTLYLPLVVK